MRLCVMIALLYRRRRVVGAVRETAMIDRGSRNPKTGVVAGAVLVRVAAGVVPPTHHQTIVFCRPHTDAARAHMQNASPPSSAPLSCPSRQGVRRWLSSRNIVPGFPSSAKQPTPFTSPPLGGVRTHWGPGSPRGGDALASVWNWTGGVKTEAGSALTGHCGTAAWTDLTCLDGDCEQQTAISRPILAGHRLPRVPGQPPVWAARSSASSCGYAEGAGLPVASSSAGVCCLDVQKRGARRAYRSWNAGRTHLRCGHVVWLR